LIEHAYKPTTSRMSIWATNNLHLTLRGKW